MPVLIYSDIFSLTVALPNMVALGAFLKDRWGEEHLVVQDTTPSAHVADIWRDLDTCLAKANGDSLARPLATVRQVDKSDIPAGVRFHEEKDWVTA